MTPFDLFLYILAGGCGLIVVACLMALVMGLTRGDDKE